MDPLAILGLIQLGASIIGGLQAQQAADEQRRLMEANLERQLRAQESLVNLAAQLANKSYEGTLSPYYSALQGRALQSMRAVAGAAGLANSGIAQAAAADIGAQVNASLLRELAQLDREKVMPLLQAQSGLAQILGQQAGVRAGLMQEYSKMGPDLSWLPLLASTRPEILRQMFGWLDFSWLGGLGGGSGSVGGGGVTTLTP